MKSQLLPAFCLAGAGILISQPAFAQVIQVTQVKLNPTENGIEVILETPAGEQLQVLPRINGNTYIADIPNAHLRVPSGNFFRQENPVVGINVVTVTNPTPSSIRVTVTGASGVPAVELFDSDNGLIFSLLPIASSTQARQGTEPDIQSGSETQPDAETPSSTPEAEPDATLDQEDEPIEIVVTGEQDTGYSVPEATTATRTNTPIRDIPQSIQVVPQQVLEDQQVIRLEVLQL